MPCTFELDPPSPLPSIQEDGSGRTGSGDGRLGKEREG